MHAGCPFGQACPGQCDGSKKNGDRWLMKEGFDDRQRAQQQAALDGQECPPRAQSDGQAVRVGCRVRSEIGQGVSEVYRDAEGSAHKEEGQQRTQWSPGYHADPDRQQWKGDGERQKAENHPLEDQVIKPATAETDCEQYGANTAMAGGETERKGEPTEYARADQGELTGYQSKRNRAQSGSPRVQICVGPFIEGTDGKLGGQHRDCGEPEPPITETEPLQEAEEHRNRRGRNRWPRMKELDGPPPRCRPTRFPSGRELDDSAVR